MTIGRAQAAARQADLRLMAAIVGRSTGTDNPDSARMATRALADFEEIHARLCGRRTARETAHSAGRIGELILIARAIGEDHTPLRAGRPGGSDLLAVSVEGQVVAFDAKATTADRLRELPRALAMSRLGRATAIDTTTGEAVHAKQGTVPYVGRDAARLTLPIDAAENTPYQFLHINYRSGGHRWGESDWYSPDLRSDRMQLSAHDEVEPVDKTLGLDDRSLAGFLAALDASSVDLE